MMSAGYMDIAGGLQDTPARREKRKLLNDRKRCNHLWIDGSKKSATAMMSGAQALKTCPICGATERGDG